MQTDHRTLHEVLKKTNSRYGLVLAAAARASELATGMQPLIQTKSRKVTTISLEELAREKVKFKLATVK